VRAYHLGKLMRQAKADDVFSFVTLREIEEQLPAVEPYLGRSRPFWLWILTAGGRCRVGLGKLSELQERVLVALAGIDPPWTLSGGAVLAGFHTAHRETRDLDLFWQRSSSEMR
jgi:hypothetical protein